MKGKLILGAEIVTKGGVDKLFRKLFTVDPDEKLLKSFAYYLCTTIDPVAGVVFISTQKLAFCSECRLVFTSPSGGLCRSYYRVYISILTLDLAATYYLLAIRISQCCFIAEMLYWWSVVQVVITLKEVRSVNSCENSEKHSEKYIKIDTVDKGEFWFMGFVNFHKALKYMKKAVESG